MVRVYSTSLKDGHGKGIEKEKKTLDRVIVDRKADLAEWVGLLKKAQNRRIQILAFANKHFAGRGPKRIQLFKEFCED
jgi:hypothetical protein